MDASKKRSAAAAGFEAPATPRGAPAGAAPAADPRGAPQAAPLGAPAPAPYTATLRGGETYYRLPLLEDTLAMSDKIEGATFSVAAASSSNTSVGETLHYAAAHARTTVQRARAALATFPELWQECVARCARRRSRPGAAAPHAPLFSPSARRSWSDEARLWRVRNGGSRPGI